MKRRHFSWVNSITWTASFQTMQAAVWWVNCGLRVNRNAL